MNIYALIILVTLIGSYLLDTLADLLNLKALNNKMPQEFSEVYKEEDYKKSQNYTITTTRFGLLTSFVNLAILLSFWLLGGFNHLDEIVRAWNYGPVATGLFYIGILGLAQTLLSLPFSIYSTFVIEEKFGFNKTTAKVFILDFFKGLLLSVILGVPLLAGILYFFEVVGPSSWWMIWAGLTLFTLLIQYIAPTWIMPLFNKFTPLEEGELKEKILAFSESVNFPLKGVYVIDGSKRSSKANAFFTGFGKNKRIALFDTLIENQTVDELVGVLAHEIGHYKKKHLLKGMIISTLQMGGMLYLLSLFLTHIGLFEAFHMAESSVYAGLIFFGLLFSPVNTILSIFMQLLSRKHEYEADEFAVRHTKTGEDLISALKKLSLNNLSNLTPHPFYVFLNYSHPPIMERIKAIRSI